MLDLFESTLPEEEKKEREFHHEVHIDIKKNIPEAAGLAGGSSNAAGVILALNQLLGMNLSMTRLCSVGEKIGADVPFCIMAAAGGQRELLKVKGGASCALAEGIGEILAPLRSVLFWVVLAKPPAGVSTAEVYRRLDGIVIKEHPATTHLIDGIESGNMQKIKSSMGNVLENVTFALCPESAKLKERLAGKGSVASLMSGSGPTVYALFRKQEGRSGGGLSERSERAWILYIFNENTAVSTLYTRYTSFIINRTAERRISAFCARLPDCL